MVVILVVLALEILTSDLCCTFGCFICQLAVDSPDTRLTIREERCYATPTQNPDDDMQYDIVRDG